MAAHSAMVDPASDNEHSNIHVLNQVTHAQSHLNRGILFVDVPDFPPGRRLYKVPKVCNRFSNSRYTT